MSKFTFVVEFEDGKEPAFGMGTEILGGRLCSASFFDYRDDHFTDDERDKITEVIEEAVSIGDMSEDLSSSLIEKLDLLTC